MLKKIIEEAELVARHAKINISAALQTGKSISFSELQRLKLYEKFEIAKGVIAVKIHADADTLVFFTTWEPFRELAKHKHPDLTKICYIAEGCLTEYEQQEKYKKGDFKMIPAEVQHHLVSCAEGLKMVVVMQKLSENDKTKIVQSENPIQKNPAKYSI